MMGLGKLGLPVALAMAMKGHDVAGCDIQPEKMQKEHFPHRELGPNGEPSIEPLLRASDLRFLPLPELVRHAEMLFVAVQTPHDPRYEGVTRLPQERVDFDYRYLIDAMLDLSAAIRACDQDKPVVIVSTVLPGTIRQQIIPRIDPRVQLCYSPLFIAMGTTMTDFLRPEFALIGSQDPHLSQQVASFYGTLHDRPVYETNIENAELIKVAYNTYISTKIGFVNTLMEVCHKLPGCDIDVVSGALALATDRLLGPRYLRGGMGDGGACHPRDNIALSWLAREIGLSYDWFEHTMLCREHQTAWLVDLVEEHHQRLGYAHRWVGLYGRAFKQGTNIVAGSPATLVANLLVERGYDVECFDPYIDPGSCPFDRPAVYLVATAHAEFADPAWQYPRGSVVIDPWRFIPQRPGVDVVPVGIGPSVQLPGAGQLNCHAIPSCG
jgi:UDPglucose 6-dehydrogenase